MKSSADLSIGELADRFGLAAHVLRHWESEGLLAPDRDALGQRRYRPGHLTQVALIVMAKDAGFTLRQLRELLATDNPMDRPELLREHVRALERRIARAQAAKDLIEHALSCPRDFHECEHAQQRIADAVPAPKPLGGSGT
ncbi:MerR family transcriptional regulator [Glycomyces sp. NPDC047010]|uniref:helix-turn-helix domain-containing protein n=1 Tax=Glycomyces sp. NPDC047010 TaxID=3155023 RepID=UPI00340602F7